MPDKTPSLVSQNSIQTLTPLFSRARVVLARPSHPGNIGAAARAMKTMGLTRLYIVSPTHYPHPDAQARAANAIDVLDCAVQCETLAEALHGVTLAAAMTARRRELSLPMKWSREAASVLRQCLQSEPEVEAGQATEVALVFGNETFGLSNEELSLCHMPVMVPTNPECSSLNLGSAVQVMCYELRMALLSAEPEALSPIPLSASYAGLATIDETEALFSHFERAMTRSKFFDPARPRRLMLRLRRMFGRMRLEREELNILRGMLSSFEAPFLQEDKEPSSLDDTVR